MQRARFYTRLWRHRSRLGALTLPIVCICILCISAQASVVTTVKYAGFAYAGDFSDMGANYPITYALSKLPADNAGVPLLDSLLINRLKSNMPQDFDLNIAEAGSIESGNTIAMAFVLYRESLSVEKFTDGYKVVVNLGAHAFFYDVREKTCVASYPVNVQYIDFPSDLPDDAYKLDTIRSLYEGNSLNVFDDFVDRIHHVKLDDVRANRLGISRISILKPTLPHLPQKFADDIPNLKNILANHLSMSFTRNQKVSVLPYSASVDGKMRIHFGDASRFTELFTIPEPDYHIELILHRFIKQLSKEKDVEKLYLYGAVVHLRILHPDSSTIYLDQGFKFANAVTVPISQLEESDWPIFEETILDLFNEVTVAFTQPSKSWTATYLAKLPGQPELKSSIAVKQMRRVQEVLEKCR